MEGFEAQVEVDGQVGVISPDGSHYRVLIPAGVGVPGADDEDLAAALVAVLLSRGVDLPGVLDASQMLARDPGLLTALEERLGDV